MPIKTLINELYVLLCISPSSHDFLLLSLYINLINLHNGQYTDNEFTEN